MQKQYEAVLAKMELPPEAYTLLQQEGASVFSHCAENLAAAVQWFYENNFAIGELEPQLAALAEKSGVNRFTLNFIFLACASKRMLADYQARGIPEEVFWETILDLKYKLFECKTVKGVYGNFVPGWYSIFYSLDLFKLGRLEFERMPYDREEPYVFGDLTIQKGDLVYSVHIPSCGKLSKELRQDAYERAYAFFAAERGDKPLICTCHSWLLFAKNREIFPSHTNLVDFMNDWDICESEETEEFSDAWRVFGCDYTGDTAALPQQNSQQRALVAWLAAGKKTGEGFGVLLFDGKKIRNT